MNHAVINKSKTNILPSGDCFYISNDPPWFLMLADGIGSGNEARFAAKIATSLAEDFCKNYFSDRNLLLPSLITRCHQNLKNSRGAAIGGVLLDEEGQQILFCGVGNIKLTLAGKKSKSLFCQPGIVGAQALPRVTVKSLPMKDYVIGFLFSDGISPDSVLKAAQKPYLPLEKLAEDISLPNQSSDDKTIIVFSINS